jgi:site-specific DNA recombinase
MSPGMQRDACAAYARAHGHEIVAEHTDLDVSGGTLDRPGLSALLERLESGTTDGLIVARLDRLSRAGVGDALKLVERITKGGRAVVAVDLGLDPTTMTGELVMTVLLALARMERRRITASWDESNARAIGRGVHFTASVPFGYVRGDDGRLCLDPTAAPLVVEVFQRRAMRESWRRIADWLNQVSPRPDGRAWSPRTVATMVQRRTYLGEAFHGEHRNPDAHDPIVTPPEWEAANAVKGGPGPIHEEGALLAGLIRCAGCRYAMRRTFTTYRDGRRVQLYSCQVRHTGGRCPAPANVMAHHVEPLVVATFLVMAAGTRWQSEAGDQEVLEGARRRLEHADGRLAAFLADAELQDAVGREAFLREAQQRREAVDEAREELEHAEKATHASTRRTFALAEEWPEWDRARQADLLRAALDAVYVRKGRGPIEDRALLLWSGEDAFDKPRRGTTDYVTTPLPWPPEPVPIPEDETVLLGDEHMPVPLAFNVPGHARRSGIPIAVEAHDLAAKIAPLYGAVPK